MKTSGLTNLMFSPVWTATLLHHFLSGVQTVNSQGVKTELIYWLLPYVYDDITREQLINARTSSTFSSVFEKKDDLAIKNSLLLKNEQIDEYREFTNYALIYLGNVTQLNVGRFISTPNQISFTNECLIRRAFCKAAHYFGVILAKEDYRNLFLKREVSYI